MNVTWTRALILLLIVIILIGFLCFLGFYLLESQSQIQVVDIIPDRDNIMPNGITWSKEYLWVSSLEGKIYKIDLSKRIPVGDFYAKGSQDLAWDGKYLWAVIRPEHRIDKIDTSDGKVLKSINVEEYPQGLTFDGKNLWYSSEKKIYEVDPETGNPLRSIDISHREGTLGWSVPSGLAWDGKDLLIATNDAEDESSAKYQTYRVGTICRFYVVNESWGKCYNLGLLNNVDGIDYDGQYLWVVITKISPSNYVYIDIEKILIKD